LPAQYFGFPTKALQAETRDQKVCSAYMAIQSGESAPPYGKYKYQYVVSNDTVSGICTLFQAAAESYIVMITTPSLATSQDLQEGCTSVLPGGCDEEK
jgi:hypothetical protein